MIGFRTALAAYAALAVFAFFTLRGKALTLALILLGGITAKTVVHYFRERRRD